MDRPLIAAVAALFVAACAGSAEPPSTPAAPPSPPAVEAAREPVLHLSIPDKVAEGGTRFKADWSFDLRATEAWSVHVHVIPPGQLVPLHRHPDNEELALVMGGQGEWETVWRDGELRTETWTLGAGAYAHSLPGAAHQVRNRGPQTLATVVVQRPEFGQNWYLLPGEVTSEQASTRGGPGEPVGPMFEGWSVAWAGADSGAVRVDRERLGFVVEGEGSLTFEGTTLPLAPGIFFKIPAGLEHRAEGAFRALDLRVPPARKP